MLGVVVGLEAERELFTRFYPEIPVEVTSATEQGALDAVANLKAAGADSLLSFGCAGALSPDLRVGDIVIPSRVVCGDKTIETDEFVREDWTNQGYTGKSKLVFKDMAYTPEILATAQSKADCYKRTRCVAADMESGIVAQSGLPFAVLRVVCDEADTNLPPAACLPLKNGKPDMPKILLSILRNPRQIGELIALGKAGSYAREAMTGYLQSIKDSDF